MSSSLPRRRRDPSRRGIQLVAAAAPRPQPTEYPARCRGVAATPRRVRLWAANEASAPPSCRRRRRGRCPAPVAWRRSRGSAPRSTSCRRTTRCRGPSRDTRRRAVGPRRGRRAARRGLCKTRRRRSSPRRRARARRARFLARPRWRLAARTRARRCPRGATASAAWRVRCRARTRAPSLRAGRTAAVLARTSSRIRFLSSIRPFPPRPIRPSRATPRARRLGARRRRRDAAVLLKLKVAIRTTSRARAAWLATKEQLFAKKSSAESLVPRTLRT